MKLYKLILGMCILLTMIPLVQGVTFVNNYNMSVINNGGHTIIEMEVIPKWGKAPNSSFGYNPIPSSIVPAADTSASTAWDAPFDADTTSIRPDSNNEDAAAVLFVWNLSKTLTGTSIKQINFTILFETTGESPSNVSIMFYNFTNSHWDIISYFIPSVTGDNEVFTANQTIPIDGIVGNDINDYMNSTYHLPILLFANSTYNLPPQETLAFDYVNLTIVSESNPGSATLYQCDSGPTDPFGKVALGFDFFNETDQADMTTVDGEAFFQAWTTDNYVPLNFSIPSFTNIQQLTICATPSNQTIFINGTIEYEDEAYRLNSFFINNLTIENGTGNIENFSLYLLHEDLGTATTLEVLDENFNSVSNVYITIQRYDVGTDTFRTVSMAKTDTFGEDITYLQYNDVWYRFLLTQYLDVKTITEVKRVTSSPITFRIFPTPYSDILAVFDTLMYNFTYDDNSGQISVVWIDPTGSMKEACLKVYKLSSGNQTFLYDQCLSTSFGALRYTPANVSGTFVADFIINLPEGSPQGRYTDSLSFSYDELLLSILNLGKEGPYFFYLGGAAIAGIGAAINPIIGILLMPLWIGISTLAFGFLDIPLTMIVVIFIVGGALVWYMRRGDQ